MTEHDRVSPASLTAMPSHSLQRYPRTLHVASSGLGGDGVPFADLAGCHLVVEEKVDGAHLALMFDEGALGFAHRGHYLSGGTERHFAPVLAWAYSRQPDLWQVLGERYELHGECLYAWHTAYYDALPHYFLEYDVRDRVTGSFLSTAARRKLLEPLGLHSVPILHEGEIGQLEDLTALVGLSAYKSPSWRDALTEEATKAGIEPVRALALADDSGQGEGLYIKVEEGGEVKGRYKWVRPDFLSALLSGEGHWSTRPLVANRLAPDADMYRLG